METTYNESDSNSEQGFHIFPDKWEEKDKEQKFRIRKNLLVICVAFFLNFTAFHGIANLQSSLNSDEGLGTASLSIVYASLILSAMFVPTFMIKKLGCKWTLFASVIGYVTYSLANFYPSWGTLVPTSIILGASGAPLWAAKCAYLTTIAKPYASLIGETVDAIVNRFFGIFFFAFQLNQIAGNLISSFVLSTANSTSLEIPSDYNKSRIDSFCGKNDCQNGFGDERNSGNEIPNSTIYILMGIYTGLGICSDLILALFVDKITVRQNGPRSPKKLLIATFTHMKDRRQILLIPLTIFSELEQGFITGDYTKSFVTCPLAVNWVGFVMICFGGFASVFSFVFGRIEKYSGRIPLFTFAAAVHLSLFIALLIWVPYPSSPAVFFIIPACWGIADAIFQTQVNALYGVLFATKQEEGFSNYRLWESLGFLIAFAYQNYVCVYVKLYVLIAMLVLGIFLYYIVENGIQNVGFSADDGVNYDKTNEISGDDMATAF